MIGDVLIQTRQVAGKWLATASEHVADDQREGPEFKELSASLGRTKGEAITGAVQEWLTIIDREARANGTR